MMFVINDVKYRCGSSSNDEGGKSNLVVVPKIIRNGKLSVCSSFSKIFIPILTNVDL